MGKPTGFLEFARKNQREIEPLSRLKNFNEFHVFLTEDERKEQAARCMNCGVPFCGSGMVVKGATVGCPLHNLIPEWNDLIYKGLYKEAYNRLSLTSNFPEFTGRVCPALCEVACTCNINDDPVSVKDNELAIIEMAYKEGWVKPRIPSKRSGKKVAIIGSGPAGLACADELNKQGHKVCVYEKNDRIGGLLMYGIPSMKLEKKYIFRRQAVLEQSGIEFVTNANVSVNYSSDELICGYDAVVIATGAGVPRDLKVPGRALGNVLFAVDYLTDNTKTLLDSGIPSVLARGKKVIVIGGGDTGNDCVGTALRQGATSVVQFEIMNEPPHKRLSTNPWPEWPNVLKVDYGAVESKALTGHDQRIFNITAKRLMGDNVVRKVEAVKVEWIIENGRRVPKEIENSTMEFDADLVLIAMGFVGVNQNLTKSFDVDLDLRGNVFANNYQTSNKKVFVCGDSHSGQSLVVKAINEGRECAIAVNDFLK